MEIEVKKKNPIESNPEINRYIEQTNKHSENCPEEGINRTTRRHRNYNHKEREFTRSKKTRRIQRAAVANCMGN